MLGKAVVLVVGSLLAVSLIVDSTLISTVSAEPVTLGPENCKILPGHEGRIVRCCQTETGQQTGIEINMCKFCTVDSNGNNVDCSTPVSMPGPNSPAGKILGAPITGITTGKLAGTALPPGSIIKVAPGTTNALTPTNNGTGNATGTLPALTVTKEHNPSSPNILNLAPNATNPSNNTSTLKLSPLTGQTSGHHHHKGTSTASTSSNSTGH